MADLRDTICALSTAPGRSGIAVVRLSGPESFAIIGKVFAAASRNGELPPRQAVLGSIVDPETGEALDQGIVTRFPAPHSYTGEDVAEISLHGSPVLIAAVLERLCSVGARLAEPGEFTMRAFLCGRIDLAQAEAVNDLIRATTLYQARVASRQCAGELSHQINPIRQALIDAVVQLESAIEFVEEDLALESRDALAGRLEEAGGKLRDWIDSFRLGRIVRDGFSMAIVGGPNVGKSSLFNALLRQERSIVTEVPGTTRDLVSESISLDGIPVHLVDTAGVRASEDRVERIGVERSLRAMTDADAILLVVDLSEPPSAEDEDLRRRLQGLSYIVVMNKCDLACRWSQERQAAIAGGWPRLAVSAKTGENIEALRGEILNHLIGVASVHREGVLITSLRHCRCLEVGGTHMARAARALRDGLSEEYVLVDLHAALRKIGAITGEVGVEDILGEIFSRFCVGK